MARWKVAGHLAVAMREAEKQAEQRRILEEQRLESVKNGKILRRLQRGRAKLGHRAARVLGRDERLFDVLNTENSQQTWDSHVASSTYFQRQDAFNHRQLLDNIDKMDSALEERRKLQIAIEMVNLKIRETDTDLAENRKKLQVVKRKLESMSVIPEEKVRRRVEIEEQRYGMKLAENRQLMDMIEHLEGEKAKVCSVHDELQADLERLSKQLNGHIDVSKTTYEQRELNKRSMNKMLDHLEKSTASHESDMQLLQFKIDVLRRMERFMTTKNKFRPDEGRDRRQRSRSQLSVTEKDSIMYSTLMKKITSDLQESDLHVIIKTFRELEEENYMLFKNISETRDACHGMQVEIDEAREKIKTLRKNTQRKERENMARKVELLEKIQLCKREGDKKEGFIQKADNIIQTYIQGIMAILNKLEYKDSDILRLAGVFKCVEERNVRVFLAEIERFVNQLHELKMAQDFMKWDRKRRTSMTSIPVEPLPPRLTLIQRVVVVPPTHEEADDVDDPTLPTEAAFRPLSAHEMVQHIEEELDARAVNEADPNLPNPTMKDGTSEATGDTPHSPTGRNNPSVDVM